MQWKDTYVDDNEPSNQMREAMAASEEDVFQIPQFKSGDIVWITYPDTLELRESHPEWIGTWHARITDVREESGEITYRVEWLEDGYKGTTTSGIPEEWVDGSEVKSNDGIIIKHNGVDVRRILDILEVYKKINVPAYIDSLEKEENPDFKHYACELSTKIYWYSQRVMVHTKDLFFHKRVLLLQIQFNHHAASCSVQKCAWYRWIHVCAKRYTIT